jgi:hypothetical protein
MEPVRLSRQSWSRNEHHTIYAPMRRADDGSAPIAAAATFLLHLWALHGRPIGIRQRNGVIGFALFLKHPPRARRRK